ncbi:MAG: hypothetical protein HYS86_03725 [Candidatus Chisholmbacteria bacterium]|nr:hypothetical protein [Candidatus Chisholmbacteria bacterium]
MRRIFLSLVLLVAGVLAFLVVPGLVRADELEDLARQIGELTRARELSEAATAPLEVELNRLEANLAGIERSLAVAAAELTELEGSIEGREEALASQYGVLAMRVRDYYKRSQFLSPLSILLSAGSAADLTRELAFRQRMTDQDKQVIVGITRDLIQLEEDKEKVETDRVRLASLQTQVDKEAAFFRNEVRGAKDYQAQLSGQIAALTARQQSILTEKAGTFQTTVGDVPLADDPNAAPTYNPGFSPAFAAFSFGAPHFKGMSQYGAFGRAKTSQNYETILKAYYGEVRIETVNTSFDLPTSVGNLPFEDNYLRGIAEMPSQWASEGGTEALKAQAVAARSYALAYTGWRVGDQTPKSAICVTEACQVYRSSKVGDSVWGQAVNDTRGKILVSNSSNEVVNAWYASTSGGYQESYSSLGHTTPAFWDTPSGRNGWTSQAWEKVGESPWFYKGWYKSRSGDSCGRSHPWLSSEEMADILNAWVVLTGGGGESSRVTPLGPCWGENPYSMADLRSIGGYTSVSSVSVTYAENGVTAQVSLGTNKGSVTISGSDFKKAFNLRAPGRVALKSGLFNIERK